MNRRPEMIRRLRDLVAKCHHAHPTVVSVPTRDHAMEGSAKAIIVQQEDEEALSYALAVLMEREARSAR